MMPIFSPYLYLAPSLGMTSLAFNQDLCHPKTRLPSYATVQLNDQFHRFNTIPACHGQTDGQKRYISGPCSSQQCFADVR